MDLQREEQHFKNHIATFTDYGNIKILDFKNPNSSEYRIRFLFEEDYYRLHISGDLGELIASNYYNMCYEKFGDFVNNTGYFKEKIDCHNRPLYRWDEKTAKEDVLKWLKDNDLYEDVVEPEYGFETEEDKLEDFFYEVLSDFENDKGIGPRGYEKLSEIDSDVWEEVSDFGKEETGILDLYMLAFKLATKQLEENKC